MRVLALLGDGFGGFGGISRFNRNLLEDMCALDRVEAVLALARKGAPDTGPLPRKLTWKVQTGKALFAAEALRTAVRMRPELVLCGLLNLGAVASAAASLVGARLWMVAHGVDAWQRPARLRAAALERSHLVTAVSRYTRGRLLSWARLAPERVRILPNTFEAERFSPGPRPAALARRYGVESHRVLLSLGRLDAIEGYKGQDRVIDVLPRLLATDPDLRFLVAGDGSDLPRLVRLAQERGVSAQVVFPGKIAEADLADLYRLADVFVMPSTGEGFGIVYLEAAACGTPVVAGCRDGSVDALREGEMGILVDPNDPGDLENGIRRALCRGRGVPPGLERFSRETFRGLVDAMLRRAVP